MNKKPKQLAFDFKDDAIFASMNPKEAAEWHKQDPEKIKYMREVKEKARAIEIAEKQMIKVARQPDSRGMFQKAVKEDEKKYQDSLKPLIDPQHFVDVSNTYDGTNYVVDENGQITDEESLKKRFEKEEIKEASPEQFRDLAYRLEKNRQMTGAEPTKLNDLKNNFKEKPFTKIADNLGKKPIKKAAPIDIKLPTSSIETYKKAVEPIRETGNPAPVENTPYQIESDPKYSSTIFGSDTYFRRKRGIDD